MSGTIDDLSPKQEALLAEFKLALNDVLENKHDDHLLLQFLRARRFDLKKSEDMFRKHLEWRKEFREEYFLNEYEPPEVLVKYIIPPTLGFDKGGSPVRFINLGAMDIRGMVHSVKLHEIKKFVVWCLDSDKRAAFIHNAKYRRFVETRTFVFDLKDLSLKQVTQKAVLEMVIALLKLYEANYPENLKIAYVVNIPYFFAWLFNIAKSILSEDTIKKIRIHGREGWKEDLLTNIDPELLPVSYGGTRVDSNGDPNCAELFPKPGPIPTKYYLKNQNKLSKEDDSVQEVYVGRRGKQLIDLLVDYPGSTIYWDVQCQSHDLNFGIYFENGKEGKGPKLDEIIPLTKVNEESGPTSGTYISKNAGKYILVFDNSYSMMRSKSVLYRVSIVPPVNNFVNENEFINGHVRQ